MMHLTDKELDRMARSRTRNLMDQLDREVPGLPANICARVGMLMQGTRPTEKSLKRTEAALRRLPAVHDVLMTNHKHGYVGAYVDLISGMSSTRTDGFGTFDDRVIYCSRILSHPERSLVVSRVAVTEHFIVRLAHRGYSVAEISMEKLLRTCRTLIYYAHLLDEMKADGEVTVVPCILKKQETGERFIAPMVLHHGDNGKPIWVAKTIYRADDLKLEQAERVDAAMRSGDLDRLVLVLRK